jgi:hypothetical protein
MEKRNPKVCLIEDYGIKTIDPRLYHNIVNEAFEEYKEFLLRYLLYPHKNSLSIKIVSEDKNISASGYFLDKLSQILELYELLNGRVIEVMQPQAFINCFKRAVKPTHHPKYIHQQGMVLILKDIPDINQEVALSHFGIKNYDQLKGRMAVKVDVLLLKKARQIVRR